LPPRVRFLGFGVHDALIKPKSDSVNTPRAQQVGTARVACDELDDDAIRELERRGLHSHRRRNIWHGRGAHSYYVRRIDAGRRE
jgi:hypothetical protein